MKPIFMTFYNRQKYLVHEIDTQLNYVKSFRMINKSIDISDWVVDTFEHAPLVMSTEYADIANKVIFEYDIVIFKRKTKEYLGVVVYDPARASFMIHTLRHQFRFDEIHDIRRLHSIYEHTGQVKEDV